MPTSRHVTPGFGPYREGFRVQTVRGGSSVPGPDPRRSFSGCVGPGLRFPYRIRSLFHHNGSSRKNLPTKGLAQQAKSHWKRCRLAVRLFLTRPSKNVEDVRPAVTDDSAMNVRAGPDAHWSPTYLIRLAQPALSGNAFEDFVRENTDENH